MTRTRDVATQGGLVLLNNTDFSAVASVSISNIFDNTYIKYRILINVLSSSGNQTLSFRCRENATDKTTGYFAGTFEVSYAAATAAIANNGGSAFLVTQNLGTNDMALSNLDIYRTATKCAFSGTGWNPQASRANFMGGEQTGMTNFTGFTIFPSNTGTITGNIKVYGYK